MTTKVFGVTTSPPPQPAWGRFLQERRERQGRSIRQAAQLANVSDAYWGQVERGYQNSRGAIRVIKPSRAKLVEMAETLRLTTKETNALLRLAEYPPLSGPGEGQPGFQDYVDLTGLSRRDIKLLNVLADRFREAQESSDESTVALTPLRRVASGRPRAAQPERETAAERRAREASAANPDSPPKKRGS